MSRLGQNSIGSFNWRENRKLSASVNSIQREHDRKIRSLSTEQYKFVSRATSRMLELVKTSLSEKEKIRDFKRSRSARHDVGSSIKSLNERNTSNSSNKLLQDSMARIHARPSSPKLIPTTRTTKKEFTKSSASNSQDKKNHIDILKYRSPLNLKRQDIKNLVQPAMRTSKSQSSSKLQPHRSHRIRGSMSFSIHPQSVSRHTILEPTSKYLLNQRRQSCPNLGWYNDRILASGRVQKDASKEKGNLGKQMEEMRKCRYLRLPHLLQD